MMPCGPVGASGMATNTPVRFGITCLVWPQHRYGGNSGVASVRLLDPIVGHQHVGDSPVVSFATLWQNTCTAQRHF